MSRPLSKLQAHFAGQAAPGAQTTGAAEQQQHAEQAEPGSASPTPSVDWRLLEKRIERIESAVVEVQTNVPARFSRVEDQLAAIGQNLAVFVAVVTAGNDEDRTHFTPAEFAQKATKDGVRNHLKERTVQRWCREGRIKATKRSSGRGEAGEWAIPRDEYTRWLNEGLLPPKD
jgi:hypothetical protein